MKDYTDIINLLDQEKAIQFLQKVVQFNTTNPPGEELGLAEYIAQTLNDHGIASHIDDLGEKRGNVLGRLVGGKERQTLLFNGHLDVVPPGDLPWKYDPFAAVIDNGKMYGRGTSDMKGGLAAMVMATCLIAQAGIPLKGDLLIAGTAGEEVDSLGAIDVVEKGYLQDVGAAVISEPSNLKVFSATKGALWLEFTTTGKTAHGSMPQFGNNAILQMNALINKLNQYQFRYDIHQLLGEPTVNIATIKGGVKTNVVPDSCTLTVDMRTVPGQDHQQIIKDIEKIIEQLEQEVAGFQGQFTVVNNRPAVEAAAQSEIIQLGVKVAQEVLELELEPCGVNYYTDASVFVPALGIPTLLFGPGDEKLAHQPDEYVEIDKYIASIKYYVGLILEYLT